MSDESAQVRDFELLRLSALGLIFLIYRAWIEFVGIGSGSGSLVSGYGFSPKWLVAIVVVGAGFLTVTLTSVWALLRPRTLLARYGRLLARLPVRLDPWRYPVAGALVLSPAVALLGDWGKFLATPSFRIALMVLAGIAAGLVVTRTIDQAPGRVGLMILLAAGVFAASKRLVQVTDYPFKLYWSEGNRLWDYSLYFARDRYQFAQQFEFPSYLTPGRHGLWGLPFLFPGAGIVALRLWDAMLWVVPAMLLGWALAGSEPVRSRLKVRGAIALWALLFLTQIGVYAPLTLSVLVVVWAADFQRPVRTGVFAGVAGLYAGLSRWTWVAAPAIIAALWMLLDAPGGAQRRTKLGQALLVGSLGLLGGLASQALMAVAFPRQNPIYSTSLGQPLLWNRLLPNATSEQGILLGALIACGPLLGLLIWLGRSTRPRWGGLESAGLAASLVAFLGVGLVASVKIGGGSNLHNLDMFMICLLVVAGLAGMRLLRRQPPVWNAVPIGAQLLVILAVLIPSFDVMRSGGPLRLPDQTQVSADLQQIEDLAGQAAEQGEVLFIDQRQLFTFGQITGVPLVVDYELKDLMNQAMGANQNYLQRFWDDLARHRFAMILTDPLPGFEQGLGYEFGEENDAWLRYVAMPLQQHYEVVVKLNEIGVRILEPKVSDP